MDDPMEEDEEEDELNSPNGTPSPALTAKFMPTVAKPPPEQATLPPTLSPPSPPPPSTSPVVPETVTSLAPTLPAPPPLHEVFSNHKIAIARLPPPPKPTTITDNATTTPTPTPTNKPAKPAESPEASQKRKENHRLVERRRRETINNGIDELALAIPGNPKKRSTVILKAIEHIRELERMKIESDEELARIREENQLLISELAKKNKKISDLLLML